MKFFSPKVKKAYNLVLDIFSLNSKFKITIDAPEKVYERGVLQIYRQVGLQDLSLTKGQVEKNELYRAFSDYKNIENHELGCPYYGPEPEDEEPLTIYGDYQKIHIRNLSDVTIMSIHFEKAEGQSNIRYMIQPNHKFLGNLYLVLYKKDLDLITFRNILISCIDKIKSISYMNINREIGKYRVAIEEQETLSNNLTDLKDLIT